MKCGHLSSFFSPRIGYLPGNEITQWKFQFYEMCSGTGFLKYVLVRAWKFDFTKAELFISLI